LAIKVTLTTEQLEDLYIKEVVKLHGIPLTIASDRGTEFSSKFWHGFQKAVGTKLYFSTAYHPQSGDQSERTIQTLEDMLRACALD